MKMKKKTLEEFLKGIEAVWRIQPSEYRKLLKEETDLSRDEIESAVRSHKAMWFPSPDGVWDAGLYED